tara:strand:- start:1893 stop:6062 length:4170 start_codon:yes stop_codon:yes gene_type:complete
MAILSDKPFKEKQRDSLIDKKSATKSIKEKLNSPRKEVKFTWEGLKKALPLFDTRIFSPEKLSRIKQLTEGAPAKEKDYIEGYEEIERVLYGGMQDLGYSIGDLVTSGIDYAFDTDYVSKLDEVYEENKIKDPETLVGEFGKVGVQFGLPGGLIFKIGARGRAIAKGKDAVNKLSKAQKVTQIGKRAGYMAGAFAATDFIAGSPNIDTLFVEKEDEEDKSGRDLALTRFKNRLRFASEGALIGGGFSLMGKPLAVGLKYGLFKPGAYAAGMGLKAADKAVITPLSFVLSRTPGVPKGIRKLRDVSAFTAEKLLNPIISRNLKFKQLPKFDDWRLFSVADSDPIKKRLKRLDNFLAKFRSVGEKTGLGYQLTSDARREIKARSRTIEKYLESLEKKSYDLARANKDLYNTKTTSPASQDYYLDQTLSYLKGQKKLEALPQLLRGSASALNKELIKTKKTFAELLPDKELKKYILDNLKSYMRKSFAVFSNPEFTPDQKVLDGAIDYVLKNVIKRNKSERLTAASLPGKATPAQKQKTYAEQIVKSILQAGKQNNGDPLQVLKDVSKYNLKSDKLIRTGEELPDAIKKLLGEEDNLKASVLTTTSHAITQSVNKKSLDKLADLGIKEGWLYRSREDAIARGVLDAGKSPVGKLKGLGLLQSPMSKLYGSDQVVQALRGTPGKLDGFIQSDIYRNLLQLKVATQFGKTVLSPATQVRNVTSASMFPLANGHIGGRASVTEALKMTLDDIFGAGKVINENEFIKNLENKIRLGVIDENIVASELKAVLQDIKAGAKVKSMDSLLNKLSNTKMMKTATRIYAGGDNLWKWYGHEYVKSQMRGMYNTVDDIAKWTKEITGREFQRFDTFTGARKSFDQAIDEAAAWQIRNTYPTYSKVPEFVQNIRKLPFGNFVSFPAEMIRTTTNILDIGMKEAMSSNPLLRQQGYRRLIGASVVLGGANEGAGQIAQALTGVEEEQIDAYKRSLSAPWNSRATIIPINKWKDGIGKAVNFSYFSPYDAVTQPFTAAIKTLEEGQMTDKKRREILFEQLSPFGDGFIGKLISPFISEAIALERISDVLPAGFFIGGRDGRTKTGSMVYSPTDEIGTQISKSFIHLLKGIEPGAVSTGRKIQEAITGDVSRGGVPRNLTDEALALFSGIRIINVDVPRTMQYKITEYNKNKRLVTSTEKLFSLQDYLTRGPAVLLDEFKAIQDENYRVNRNFYNVLKDAETVGMSERDLRKLLNQRGISRKNARSLLKGKNIPYTGYKERMKKRVKEAEKLAKDEGRGRVNRDYFYPRSEFRKIEREYKRKSLNPEAPVKRSIIDNVMDLFSERVTPQGKTVETAQIQEIKTPPLPGTPMPNVKTAAANVNPITNLTRTQEALLSPEEKIIASRT